MWKRAADVRSSAVDRNGRLWIALRLRDMQKQPAFCTSTTQQVRRLLPARTQRAAGRQVRPGDRQVRGRGHLFQRRSQHVRRGQQHLFRNEWRSRMDRRERVGQDARSPRRRRAGVPRCSTPNLMARSRRDGRSPTSRSTPRRIIASSSGAIRLPSITRTDSLWCSGIGRGAKRLMRLERGSNAPLSCKAEFFEPPPNRGDRSVRIGRSRGRPPGSCVAELASERPVLGVRPL